MVGGSGHSDIVGLDWRDGGRVLWRVSRACWSKRPRLDESLIRAESLKGAEARKGRPIRHVPRPSVSFRLCCLVIITTLCYAAASRLCRSTRLSQSATSIIVAMFTVDFESGSDDRLSKWNTQLSHVARTPAARVPADASEPRRIQQRR